MSDGDVAGMGQRGRSVEERRHARVVVGLSFFSSNAAVLGLLREEATLATSILASLGCCRCALVLALFLASHLGVIGAAKWVRHIGCSL